MDVRAALFALVTPDGDCAMFRDGEGHCLMLVFTTISRALKVARFLQIAGTAMPLPSNRVDLVTQTRHVGAVGIVVDFDPDKADGAAREQWVPEPSA